MSHPPAKLHPLTSLPCNYATSAHGQRLSNIRINHAHDATTHTPGEERAWDLLGRRFRTYDSTTHTPGEGRAWDLLGPRFRTFSTTLGTLKRAEPNAPLRAKSLAQHHKQSRATGTRASSPLLAFVLTPLRCSHHYVLVGSCALCMSRTQQGICEVVGPLRFSRTPHASTALASPW